MASKEEVTKATAVLGDALGAYKAVSAIQAKLQSYHLSVKGVVFGQGGALDFLHMDKDVVLLKSQLDKLAHFYAPLFKEEFKALDQKKLISLGCLGSIGLLSDVDLLVNVGSVQIALQSRINLLRQVLIEGSKASTDTSAINRAVAATGSPVAGRYTDISTDLNTWMSAKESTVQAAASHKVSQVTSYLKDLVSPVPLLGTTVLFLAGVDLHPMSSASEALKGTKEAVLGLAYPKATRYCNAARNKPSDAATGENTASLAAASAASSASAEAKLKASRTGNASASPEGATTLGQTTLSTDKKLQASLQTFSVEQTKLLGIDMRGATVAYKVYERQMAETLDNLKRATQPVFVENYVRAVTQLVIKVAADVVRMTKQKANQSAGDAAFDAKYGSESTAATTAGSSAVRNPAPPTA